MPCECEDGCDGLADYIVIRDGREMQVCNMCIMPKDTEVKDLRKG